MTLAFGPGRMPGMDSNDHPMRQDRLPNRHALLRTDRLLAILLFAFGLLLAGRVSLHEHPQHNPLVPLNLNHPLGWATQRKFAALRGDPLQCRMVLDRSAVAYVERHPAGAGPCLRADRIVLEDAALAPSDADTTCAVAAGLAQWEAQIVAPAARDILGSELTRIEHLGTYACRRLYGRTQGAWSQHATGNAIDISAFVLEDGRRVSVLEDWADLGPKGQFLRTVRDGACIRFATVLSPAYNAAHADHFHLDQQERGWGGVCR